MALLFSEKPVSLWTSGLHHSFRSSKFYRFEQHVRFSRTGEDSDFPPVARRAHNLKVIGSNPIPATKQQALENAQFSRAFCCVDFGPKFRSWKRQEESRGVKSARQTGAMTQL
jgi:hypothetical protein